MPPATSNVSKVETPPKGERSDSTGFFTLDSSPFSYAKSPARTKANTTNDTKDNTEVSPLHSKPPLPKPVQKSQSLNSMTSNGAAVPPTTITDTGSLGSAPSQQDMNLPQQQQEGENHVDPSHPPVIQLPLHKSDEKAQYLDQQPTIKQPPSPPHEVERQKPGQLPKLNHQQQPQVRLTPPSKGLQRQQSLQSLPDAEQQRRQTQASISPRQLRAVRSQPDIRSPPQPEKKVQEETQQIPSLVTLPVESQGTNTQQSQKVESPASSNQQSQLHTIQQPQKDNIIGMMGAVPIIKLQGQQHVVVKKKGRFSVIEESPAVVNATATATPSISPLPPPATQVKGANNVAPKKGQPVTSNASQNTVTTALTERIEATSEPVVKKKGRFVVTDVKDPSSIPNSKKSQTSLAASTDKNDQVQSLQPPTQKPQIVQPQILIQPNQQVIQNRNQQQVQTIQPVIVQGTAPLAVSSSASNNVVHQPQQTIATQDKIMVVTAPQLVSATDIGQKWPTTVVPPPEVSRRSTLQKVEKPPVVNGITKKKPVRKPPPIDRNDTWNSFGLGKLSYLLDQMKTEVTDADHMIKTLQTDLKLLRAKNKELEAKNRDLERNLKQEKSQRDKAEARNTELRKQLMEATAQNSSNNITESTDGAGASLVDKVSEPKVAVFAEKDEGAADVSSSSNDDVPESSAPLEAKDTINKFDSQKDVIDGNESGPMNPVKEKATERYEERKYDSLVSTVTHSRSNSGNLDNEKGSLKTTPVKSTSTHRRSNSSGFEYESDALNTVKTTPTNITPVKKAPATVVQSRRNDVMTPPTANPSLGSGVRSVPISEFDPLRQTQSTESNVAGEMVPVFSIPTQLSLGGVPINAPIFQNSAPSNGSLSSQVDQSAFVSENPYLVPVTLGMAPAIAQNTGDGVQQTQNDFQGMGQQSFMVFPQQQPIMFQQVPNMMISQQSSFPQNSVQVQQQTQQNGYFNAADSFDPLVGRR